MPEIIEYNRLLALLSDLKDTAFEKLGYEYLPLTFSRRHGDPSRPWNMFAIEIKDEHGQKIQKSAAKHGMSPQEYVDGVVATFKDLWERLKVDYTEFVRTTSDEHRADVEYIFKKVYDKGDIYKDKYEGYYCLIKTLRLE